MGAGSTLIYKIKAANGAGKAAWYEEQGTFHFYWKANLFKRVHFKVGWVALELLIKTAFWLFWSEF